MTGTGGAFLAATRARPRSPDRPAWLPYECVTVFVLLLFCVLYCGQEQRRTQHAGGPIFCPEEIEPGFQVVRAVALRRIDSGPSQEEPAAEHKRLPCWLRGQGGGIVMRKGTERSMLRLL